MYEVGNIIFLVSRKAQSVLAAQICEQNVKKTLEQGLPLVHMAKYHAGNVKTTSRTCKENVKKTIRKREENVKKTLKENVKKTLWKT